MEAIMNFTPDREVQIVYGGILAALVISTVIASLLRFRVTSDSGRAVVGNLVARIRSWWVMCAVFFVVQMIGLGGSLILFTLLSFLALREYLTLIQPRRADHRTLFWSFFIFTPLQYYLLWIDWYGLFSILIPVYVFLFIPTRLVLTGDTEGFLERASKIQWGLMICTYCLSYTPALLILPIPNYEGENAKLLLFLVLVDQASDVLQYVFGKLFGRRKIAPLVSPNKTWEGFLGGVVCATLLGTGLWWITPFAPLQAAALSLSIALMGFAGGLTMSAIKRDRRVKDYGTLIGGHGGILDRVDSLCFAAPVFFHFVRYYFTP
jgi:phosphatidate cytidylyltransferase